VQLPPAVPFNATQPFWWSEYFLFNATFNQTINFKLYAGMFSDAHLSLFVGTDFCPVWVTWNAPSAYGYGTASVIIKAVEGHAYVVFGHMSGGNYTIFACENECPEKCPNDCTNFNGLCNLTDGSCLCRSGFSGVDCSIGSNVTHPKVPFGNIKVFYSVVAGLPTVFAIAIATVVVVGITNRKKKALDSQTKNGYHTFVNDMPPPVPQIAERTSWGVAPQAAC
jgi:hypothetical protein